MRIVSLHRNLPPPAKQSRLCLDDTSIHSLMGGGSSSSSSIGNSLEIPHVLQGEIARLDQKFKVSLDPSTQSGTKIIKLVCCLDDKFLPCIPPVSVVIPGKQRRTSVQPICNLVCVSDDYPSTAPSCKLIEQEYNSSPLFISIQGALTARISKLPKQFSLSHLLDTWEMSVRQACSPNRINPTATSVLLGI